MTGWTYIAIVLGGSMVGSLCGSELVLRATARPGLEDVPSHFVDRPGFFHYRPDFTYDWTNEDGERISVFTDENGFRNPRGYLSLSAAILLGDSYVAGVNTREDRTLAGRLRVKGLPTYNAGVDMFSNGDALHALKYLTGKVKPKIVVLALYQGNDFHDNYFARPPQPAASGLAGRLKRAYFALAERSLLLRALHTHVYLGILKGKARDPMGSFALSEMLAYRNRYVPAMEVAKEKTDSLIGAFAAQARHAGFRFLILGIPSKAAVLGSFKEIAMYQAEARAREFALETIRGGYSFDKPDSLVGALARKHGVRYLSLLPLFRSHMAEVPYYRLDSHWRAAGQSLAADALWQELQHPE